MPTPLNPMPTQVITSKCRPGAWTLLKHATQDAAMVAVFLVLGWVFYNIALALGAPSVMAWVIGACAFGTSGAYLQLAAEWWVGVAMGSRPR